MEMQMIEMKKVKLDKKTRVSIALVTILLGINSLNLILDKLIHITLTENIFRLNIPPSYLFELYSTFCWVWLDIVALVNGLFFV